MKPVLLLFIAIVPLSLKSQSVVTTKSWIIDKLTRYQQEIFGGKISPCESYTQNYGYSFTFKKDSFIISYNIRVLYPQCYVGDKVKNTKGYAKKVIGKISLSDILEVTSITNNFETRMMITTKRQTIRLISVFADSTVRGYTNMIFIGVNFNTEERLLERLQEAFYHLRSLYPEKKRKEAF